MEITILRSTEDGGVSIHEEFTINMDTQFARRFISHLKDEKDFCTACGDECINCRNRYNLVYSNSIKRIINFPSSLPAILEEPELYTKNIQLEKTDIVISLSVNEEILIEIIKNNHNFKGLIVPIEKSGTITPYGKREIKKLCGKYEIEVDFPKPFCAFNPSNGILREFKRTFRIGLPEIEITQEGNYIKDVRVNISAPCGATYFVAKNLIGHKIDDNLPVLIDTLLSRYPCTADSSFDREIGDSIIHLAVMLQRIILKSVGIHS